MATDKDNNLDAKTACKHYSPVFERAPLPAQDVLDYLLSTSQGTLINLTSTRRLPLTLLEEGEPISCLALRGTFTSLTFFTLEFSQ